MLSIEEASVDSRRGISDESESGAAAKTGEQEHDAREREEEPDELEE